MSANGAPKAQLHELTSTRFFAAMAVLLGHFSDFLAIPAWLVPWIAGGFGVSFFFVLSGFILCYRYWDDFAHGVAPRPYRRYFVARIARVYPSYVAALVIITALYLAMNLVKPGHIPFPENPLVSWLANLFALQTFAPSYLTQQIWNGPGWSISTEFGFYLVCPLILAAVARHGLGRRGLFVLLGVAIAFAVAMQVLALFLVFRLGWQQQIWLDVVASRNIFWRLPEFVTGIVAARLLYGGHLPRLERAAARNLLLAVSLALMWLLNLAPWPADGPSIVAMRQLRFGVGYMLPFAGIVLALAAGPTVLSPVLRRPSLVFLGDVSYAVYIYHWIPWMAVAHGRASGLDLPPGLVTWVIVLTILFSAASYLWYEKPVRQYLRKKLGP